MSWFLIGKGVPARWNLVVFDDDAWSTDLAKGFG